MMGNRIGSAQKPCAQELFGRARQPLKSRDIAIHIEMPLLGEAGGRGDEISGRIGRISKDTCRCGEERA